MKYVRTFLSVEAIAFLAAALVHAGLIVEGYQHRQAAIAETVIGIVLIVGLVLSAVAPGWSRAIGLAAQGFALAGTFVGVVMIAIGIGPQTTFDRALHAVLVALLSTGLIVVARRDLVLASHAR